MTIKFLPFEGVVYCYELLEEGEQKGYKYVGETTQEQMRRSHWGGSSYGGSELQKAFRKYGTGKDVWQYSVLERMSGLDYDQLEKDLQKKEEEYIKKFNSTTQDFNTSIGGTGNKGVTFDDERKANMFHRDYQTEETKEKISKSLTGHTVSQETRDKISVGNTGKTRTEEQNQAQSERMKGIFPKALYEGSVKWREKNGGGVWHNRPFPESMIANMKAAQQKRGKDTLVERYDEQENVIKTEVFPTMQDAAKALGIKVGSVFHYLKTGNMNKKLRVKIKPAP